MLWSLLPFDEKGILGFPKDLTDIKPWICTHSSPSSSKSFSKNPWNKKSKTRGDSVPIALF